MMGKCPSKFRLKFEPTVFTFSFTSKELQTNPWTSLKERFEQLDIKLMTEYQNRWTTHVLSKKRNTAKGLQALINANSIVTESFLDAVVQASRAIEGDASALEDNFEEAWPKEFDHLPPKGGEPVEHPDEIYKPDQGRANIFEGYTFIFYDKGQFNNLLAAITNGGGKALYEEVNPDETQVDDFIRFVKGVAGEKGLGCFEDGSEGKGVVLVRYVPSKGPQIPWYSDFFTDVSLRLDHRPIEQSEFLEAILIKDASILRRPLEVESTQDSRPQRDGRREALQAQEEPAPEVKDVAESHPAPRRRGRRSIKQRFVGFDDGDDDRAGAAASHLAPEPDSHPPDEESGLFVSQEPSHLAEPARTSQPQRKRAAPQGDDLMEGMAPAAERFKRQRLEHGSTFASPEPESEPQPETAQQPKRKQKKKDLDFVAAMAQNRQQEEERARKEKEDLANLPEDVDLSEIRRLNLVEELEVRQPNNGQRTRDQDVADGRWNPKWNGMKNFKKFRRRGEHAGRQPARTIVPLTETKPKEFGVGDDYWLEDGESQRRRQAQSQSQAPESQPEPPRARLRASRAIGSDSNDDEDASALVDETSQIRSGTTARGKESQSSKQTSQGKRSAAEPPARQQAAKRQRPAKRAVEVADSEDSDDDMKFAFGRRR